MLYAHPGVGVDLAFGVSIDVWASFRGGHYLDADVATKRFGKRCVIHDW